MNLQITTIIIVAANLFVSIRGFNDSTFFDRYKFMIGPIKSGQRERLFTSGFLHVDFSHLFFNMFTLYFFADVVSYHFGSFLFVGLYLFSLITGSLFSLFHHKQQPYYSAVGASGAVTGILYAAILLQPNMQLGIMFIPIPLPAYVVGIGYLFYSIYGMKKSLGNIGHTAHLGGAIGGYIGALVLQPSLLFTHTMAVALLALPIVILFALAKAGKL